LKKKIEKLFSLEKMVRTYGTNNGSLGGVFAQNKVRLLLLWLLLLLVLLLGIGFVNNCDCHFLL
jgi:hypothetical protein